MTTPSEWSYDSQPLSTSHHRISNASRIRSGADRSQSNLLLWDIYSTSIVKKGGARKREMKTDVLRLLKPLDFFISFGHLLPVGNAWCSCHTEQEADAQRTKHWCWIVATADPGFGGPWQEQECKYKPMGGSWGKCCWTVWLVLPHCVLFMSCRVSCRNLYSYPNAANMYSWFNLFFFYIFCTYRHVVML